eukprot:CAMPEP_0176499814 /NCGR_PEP_ID=MMETSP0200_2-20121128/13157_1 /TAXON_ID=947934 /ORGANISM="Chaetoceros sp., Strain GSL56" /LENGTH=1021 /DNA_ID=CAMNT_0017898317 /DNA_START=99 /DNA_END=3164 /DNA_ORIENTATION=-
MSREKETPQHSIETDNNNINNSNGSHHSKCTEEEPDAAAVLKFLRKRGLDTAILEVQRHLDNEEGVSENESVSVSVSALNNGKKSKKDGEDRKIKGKEYKEPQTDEDENAEKEEKQRQEQEREQSLEMSVCNDDNDNDDDDGDCPMESQSPSRFDREVWLNDDDNNHSHDGTRADLKNTIRIKRNTDILQKQEGQYHDGATNQHLEDQVVHSIEQKSRQDEARRYLEAFTAFQTWALNLPDDVDNGDGDGQEVENKHESSNKTIENASSPQNMKMQQHMASFLQGYIKPEILLVTFPLFCYTYCDLLENHLEHTAAELLSTFQPIHEPRFPMEFRDLEQNCTTEHILELKKNVMEVKDCMSKMKRIQKSCDECRRQQVNKKETTNLKVIEALDALETEYKECAEKHKKLSKQLKQRYPFLSRAMFMKCYLNISSTTYGYLARYLRSDDMLLPMSILLQSRCRVVVEKRRPLAFVPACVLEDTMYNLEENNDDHDVVTKKDKRTCVVARDIQWAAPMHPLARSNELGDGAFTVMKNGQGLPFPKFYLNKEYDSVKDYRYDKRCVEFNRALLTNGFRRLAALELKDEYDCGLRLLEREQEGKMMEEYGNPLEPSVLLSTLCTSLDVTKVDNSKVKIEKAGIEITCAKLSPNDGRFIAAGCSDSAVRIWSADSWSSLSANGSLDVARDVLCTDPAVVLIGHKSGLPVFDLAWNRDGRTLISAGGDGSLRLWDTRAVGSIGETAQIGKRENNRQNGTKDYLSHSGRPSTRVPGAKAEFTAHRHGSALVCYQGHSPMTPVWSVSIAPCGYYFASAGADSTARLWCTDRKTPVRIFAGHCNENVNTVTWHPNCNYILTGSDDKTVRMWDIQSSKCVRLFNGCPEGVNEVKVSYSGLYVAGADYSGVVHMWDVRNGKKLNEFRCSRAISSGTNHRAPIVRSLSFSRCGTAIATGSDDCTVRIWDCRTLGKYYSNSDRLPIAGQNNELNTMTHLYSEPNKYFRTKCTSLLDLQYTKQNLLLSVGKYLGV